MEVINLGKFFIRKTIIYFLSLLAIMICFVFISKSEIFMSSVCDSLQRCINIIIPSLFSFMAVSSIITKSGLYHYISKPFFIVSKYLMNINPDLFFVFLFGNISGYPVGISILSDLVKQKKIDKKTAEIMSCFCYCGGPAFYNGTIGLTLYGNIKIGLLIFSSIVLTNFVIALILGRFLKSQKVVTDSKVNISSEMIINSVISTGKSLFVICVMIVFFSVISSLLEVSGFFELISKIFSTSDNTTTIIKSVLEISSLTNLKPYQYNILPLITGICSFGGICVLLQVSSLCNGAFSLKLFWLTRPINAVISFFICTKLKAFFIPDCVDAITNSENVLFKVDNFIPSICLIIMILLLNFKKRLVFYKRMCYNKCK